MIYLDVTGACHSGLNTGIKRVQRAMHGWLKTHVDYQPVCWQSARRGYRRLDEQDIRTLEMPTDRISGTKLVDSFAPGFFSDHLNVFKHAPLMHDWPEEWHRNGVLLAPDVLFDNRRTYLSGLQGTRVRRVGIFHDAVVLRRPRQSRIDHFFATRGVRAMAALDGVVCASQEAEDDLRFFWKQWGLKPVPTFALHWPVPFVGARPATEPDPASRTVLYVARLEEHKNHMCLLAACSLLWEQGVQFELRLIGCFSYPDTALQITRRVRQLQQAGRAIRWEAHVGETELHQAYRDSMFTVYPSLMEGFGLPILESLWHGRPVVCGGNGALGEVAAGGGCELVDNTSKAGIAEGLRRLLDDPAHYRALCLESQRRRFRHWDDYWAELLPMIQPARARVREHVSEPITESSRTPA